MKSIADQIAHELLRIGAVDIRLDPPYTWSSGWQSPMYCDNRLTLSYPEVRGLIRDGFMKWLGQMDKIEGIAGVATAGIPHGMLLAEEAGLPFLYVRSKTKSHGRQNQIEGQMDTGMRLIVIEDLFSTGGSSIQAARALHDTGASVVEVWSIFSYGFEASSQAFDQAGFKHRSLVQLEDLLRVARDQGMLDEKQVAQVEDWRRHPSTWPADHIS